MAQPDGFVPVGVEDKQPQVAVSITQPQPQPPEQPKPEEKQSEQAVAQQPVAQPETKANQPSEPQANGKSSKKLKKKRKPIRPAPAERVSSDIGPIPHLQITIIAPTPKASSGPGKAVKEQKSPRKQESKDAGALKPAAQAADTPARRLSQSRAAEPAQPPSLGVACGIRSAAIMIVVTNFAMFICNIVAVSKRGGLSEEDVNCNRSPSCGYPPRIGLTEQLSVTEVVLTIVSLITLLLNCARLRQTLFGIQMGNKPSWQWHHTETIRTMLMLLFASVWFYPAVVNFLFHSLGTNFSDLERDANAKLRDYLTFHIVAFVLVVLTSLLSAWFIQKLLHIVRGEGEQKITAGLLTAGRLSIVLALLAQAAFVIALLLDANYSSNVGTVICALLYIVFVVAVTIHSVRLLCERHMPESFFMTFRMAHGAHLYFAILFFWISLSLVLLVEKFPTGFWSGVADLDDSREVLIYSNIGLFILYSLSSALKMYLHKHKAIQTSVRGCCSWFWCSGTEVGAQDYQPAPAPSAAAAGPNP